MRNFLLTWKSFFCFLFNALFLQVTCALGKIITEHSKRNIKVVSHWLPYHSANQRQLITPRGLFIKHEWRGVLSLGVIWQTVTITEVQMLAFKRTLKGTTRWILKGVPKTITKDSYQRQLPKTVTKDNYQRQLPKTITKDSYQRQLPKTVTKDNYQRQLPKTITKDSYQRQLPMTITKDNYQRQLPKTVTKDSYQRQLPKTVTKDNYQRQ